MRDMVLRGRKGEVVMGPGRPLVLIGERLNPTGRKALAADLAAGDFSRFEADAIRQVEAGAHMLDVNAGIPLIDEPAVLAEAVRRVQAVVHVPLAIDSSVPEALAAGLEACEGRPLVNSVTGEEGSMAAVLPLVAAHGAAVVAIPSDRSGIPGDAGQRFEVARKIVERAEAFGIAPADVAVDPLVLPVGADAAAGRTALDLVVRLGEELGVNTTCGLSNVSFGLPDRGTLNATFLAMLVAAGLTSAIGNPFDDQLPQAMRAGEVLLGRDDFCRAWITGFRARQGAADSGAG